MVLLQIQCRPPAFDRGLVRDGSLIEARDVEAATQAAFAVHSPDPLVPRARLPVDYLIDHRGVLRFAGVDQHSLQDAIQMLVEERQRALQQEKKDG